jgi:hypothetical protein
MNIDAQLLTAKSTNTMIQTISFWHGNPADMIKRLQLFVRKSLEIGQTNFTHFVFLS